jgi:hypothetical protein
MPHIPTKTKTPEAIRHRAFMISQTESLIYRLKAVQNLAHYFGIFLKLG